MTAALAIPHGLHPSLFSILLMPQSSDRALLWYTSRAQEAEALCGSCTDGTECWWSSAMCLPGRAAVAGVGAETVTGPQKCRKKARKPFLFHLLYCNFVT